METELNLKFRNYYVENEKQYKEYIVRRIMFDSPYRKIELV